MYETFERRKKQRVRNAFWMWHGALKVGILPMAEFLNGHLYFTRRLQEYSGVAPIAVHLTYQFGDTADYVYGACSLRLGLRLGSGLGSGLGSAHVELESYSVESLGIYPQLDVGWRVGVTTGKRQRLREHGIWLMEEEAYFTEGNFLVITHPEEGYRHVVDKYSSVASVCEPTDPVQSKCWHGARLTAKSVADGKLDPRDPERYECFCRRRLPVHLPLWIRALLHPHCLRSPPELVQHTRRRGARGHAHTSLYPPPPGDDGHGETAHAARVERPSDAIHAEP